MAEIFISYSTKDREFVRRLVDELEAHGRDVWVDWEDIKGGDVWWARIKGSIEEAGTFIIVISENSLTSEHCNKELLHAREHRKRIIWLIRQDIAGAVETRVFGEWYRQRETWEHIARANWDYLQDLQWVEFREQDDFAIAFEKLTQALEEANQTHLQRHTELLMRAKDWDSNGRDRGYLLRGAELVVAEKWLADAVALDPKPATLHIQYITASQEARRTAAQRQRGILVGVSLLAAIAIVLALLSFFLSRKAVSNEHDAQTQAAIAGDNAGTATVALGLSEQRGTEVAFQAATAVVAQEQALIGRDQALLANAQFISESDPLLALALVMEVIPVDNPPVSNQRVLAQLAYAPGARLPIFTDSEINSVVFTPDGQSVLSASNDGTLTLWDAETGAAVRPFEGHTGPVWSVALSPDGTMALSGSDDTRVILWDVATGEALHRLEGHTGPVLSVAFSPDGTQALSGSDDMHVILWDVATGEALHRLEGHTGPVLSVAFSPDGTQVLSGSEDSDLILWDIDTGEVLQRFEDHSDQVFSVAFSPDGTMALSGSDDTRVILWDVATGEQIYRFAGAGTNVLSVAFSPDGQTAAAGTLGGAIVVWDIDSQEEIRRFTSWHTGAVKSIAFDPDGHRIASGSSDTTMMLWNVEMGAMLQQTSAPGYSAQSIAFSPRDEHVAVLGGCVEPDLCLSPGQGRLTLWDVERNEEIRRFTNQDGDEAVQGVTTVDFHPDGDFVLTGAYGALLLWDVDTGTIVQDYGAEPSDWFLEVAFDPKGNRFLTSVCRGFFCRTGDLILWDLETGAEIYRFPQQPTPPTSAAFSPDGRMALSGSWDGTLTLWNVEEGSPDFGIAIRTFRGHRGPDTFASMGVFSPDGKTILTGSVDSTVILWDLETGEELRRFLGHTKAVEQVAFSPDGTAALSAADDNLVIIWDIATGSELRRFAGHRSEVSSAAFDPNGKTVLSGSKDGTYILWRIDSYQELLAWTSANRYVRELTCDEQIRFGLQAESSCSQPGELSTGTPYTTTPPVQ